MGTIFVLLMLYLATGKSGVEGARSISRKQEYDDLDLEMQFKLLNKPPVKSIKFLCYLKTEIYAIVFVQTKYGDIYDCVDIKKQPAFDHPLLRNHTIQMKPSSFPIGMINKELLESKPSKVRVKSSGCPPRTVLIQRIQKEDIIRAKSQVRRHPGNVDLLTTKNPGYHFATFQLGRSDVKYYGGYVSLALDQPKVSSINQFSEAVLWVENGPVDQLNSLQVGWAVNPKLFGDNRTRMFSYWTADGFHKTGCFNLLCPGFVQVSCIKTFGYLYSDTSPYGDLPFEDEFILFKDPESGNWWLVTSSTSISGEHEYIGYWPSSLFTTLRDSASIIASGGEVYSPTSEPSPQMGRGRLPIIQDDDRHATWYSTYARKLQFVDEKFSFVNPDASLLKIHMDSIACYKAESLISHNPYRINTILFGGPGGQCGI
ncbi:uncharacterized protein LOC122651159 [Telopea speciosissima]|uniref:uncharacterized protein LOC122651159 n=1 Tax=Telopea speciosissima TaxID=54955 RepID=UPI001CC60DC0|nr:uncharacterized protein LOC122651159 [Telopea speciosissima]